MRILIAGPPRAGNKWLKCLLGAHYQLPRLSRDQIPTRPRAADLLDWMRRDSVPDSWIFHQHLAYDRALADACEQHGIQVVTILRDPYDMWRSSYMIGQHPPRQRLGRATRLGGLAMDSPEVLASLRAGSYLGTLKKGVDWLVSGRSHIIRYEDLLRDPEDALRKLTDRLGGGNAERLPNTVEFCRAENMRMRRPQSVSPARVSSTGAPDAHLPPAIYEVFREPQYAALIECLGYSVR